MVLDPMSMRARGCGPFEGLLHTPSVGTQKKIGQGGPFCPSFSNEVVLFVSLRTA